MQIEATEGRTTSKLPVIPNRPEADSIAVGETPLIRYTPGDSGTGITEVSTTNHWISDCSLSQGSRHSQLAVPLAHAPAIDCSARNPFSNNRMFNGG